MTTTSADSISSYYEKARVQLKADRDSIVQKIKDEISAAKRKAISKA
ncbi:MAG TPA: hypothetical protein VE264_03000 [Nitrososphaera sp.]|jgi:hypothetical protein|nr:hypothetical protein [Nitrososphaera sp.]